MFSRFQPTDYERELFKTYKGKVKDLSEADQFIVEVHTHPYQYMWYH